MHCDALVVIDCQVALMNGAYRADRLKRTIVDLIESARRTTPPVIFVVHNHSTWTPLKRGAPGWAIDPDLAPAEDEPIVEKTASDAFYRTSLLWELKVRRAETIAVVGMQTEFCVDTTARAALNYGFDVVLPDDGHTTSDGVVAAQAIIDHHNATLAGLAHPSRSIHVMARDEIQFARGSQAAASLD